jgi:Undecaprenyl-phosphate glucose phosphotransferase
MVTRQNRLLVTLYVLSDAVLGMAAFLLAYALRFHAGIIPVTKGIPPLMQYLAVAPFVGLLVPAAFQIQGIYHLRRGRSRVDDFFAVFVGSILAVVLGIVGTLYLQAYYVSDALKEIGALEVSQLVWGLFLVLNVSLTYATREVVRESLERRWRAGIGLKRVAIAGVGDLGRLIADKILEHRELGYRILGFIDDAAADDHIGYRGLPLLGTVAEAEEIVRRESIDQLYLALPLEAHEQTLHLLEVSGREYVDARFVPDLLQFIALRARLEDLDGVPVISLNDVPLQGFNSVLKRLIDIGIAAVSLLVFSVPMAILAALVRLTSPGPVFYRQERMGLDGKSFTIYKFRSMVHDAERDTGPIFASEEDPRRTGFGAFLRRYSLDELPQLINVLKGDMSIVGPRPERPPFVEQFKHRYPQYMLRHKVKSGMTGWAQVNGWRGNTSIEKRIEYDLYYIENWSLSLDIKIMWLTLLRGFHTHAY